MDLRVRLACTAAALGLAACQGTAASTRRPAESPATPAAKEPLEPSAPPPAPAPAPSPAPSAAVQPAAAPPAAPVSPPGSVARLLRLGTPLEDGARALAGDGAGNLFLAGKWGAQPSRANQAFVAKIAPSDTVAWTATLQSEGSVSVGGVAVSKRGEVFATGGYTRGLRVGGRSIAGDARSDIFLLKLNKSGQPVFLKRFASRWFESARGIAVDASGGVFLTGTYQGELSFGGPKLDNGGVYDVFVARLDSEGRHVWSKGFSARGGTETTGVAVSLAPSGELLVTGRVQGGADFGGGPISCAGDSAAFVARFTPAGKFLSGRVFSGRGSASGSAVAADEEGAFVAGSFSDVLDFGDGPRRSRGGTDLFVLRLDKEGGVLWSRQFGDTKWDTATGLALGRDGSLWVAGQFADSVSFGDQSVRGAGKDGLVLALDRSGAAKAVWVLGGDEEDAADAILASGQRIVVAGTFAGAGSFAGKRLASEGLRDLYLLELASEAASASPAAPSASPPAAPEPQGDSRGPADPQAGPRAKKACERGDLETVRRLVPAQVPPSWGDGGWSLVMVAAYNGKAQVLRHLLASGGDPNSSLDSGYTCLMQAARFGHLDAVKALVEGGADVNRGDSSRNGTALHLAVREAKGDAALIAYLLEHGARLEARDARGQTPLVAAAAKHDPEAVKRLAAAGAALDASDESGNSALDFAAMAPDAEAALFLLGRGAAAERPNASAMTALFHASHAGGAAIVGELLRRGASANPVESRYGDTALMRAANNGHLEVVRLLVEAGAPVQQVNKEGLAALHMAARNGRDDVVQLLVQRGADPGARTPAGEDAASLARKSGHRSTAALLEKLRRP